MTMEEDHTRDYQRKRRVEALRHAIESLEPNDLPYLGHELASVRKACEHRAAQIVRVWD